MKNILLALSFIALGASAHAQNMNSTSTAQSAAQSGVYQEGDDVENRSGSAVAPSANSTAECVIGTSAGLSVVGTGVAFGSGRINQECITRKEAKILSEIATMRGTQRQVTIYHFCRNDRTMRNTMIAMGWCRVAR